MLRPLPFASFGEIAALGREVHVYCTRCHSWRRVDLQDERLRDRYFAGARFTCQATRYDGSMCSGFGHPSIRKPDRVRPDSGLKYANLSCERCVPPWELLEVDRKAPPWSLPAGDRFRCPGCGGPVTMRCHGPPWRPTYSYGAAAS